MYARGCQSMPEDIRVCQSMPEYVRVCQSIPEYARVCQSMPEYARVCHSMSEYAKVCKSMPWLSIFFSHPLPDRVSICRVPATYRLLFIGANYHWPQLWCRGSTDCSEIGANENWLDILCGPMRVLPRLWCRIEAQVYRITIENAPLSA